MLDDEDEGGRFEFEDSGDEAPEADRLPPDPEGTSMALTYSSADRDAPVNRTSPNPENLLTAEADLPPPPQDCPANNTPLALATFPQGDLPPPPADLCYSASQGQDSEPIPTAEGTTGAAVYSQLEGTFTLQGMILSKIYFFTNLQLKFLNANYIVAIMRFLHN